MSFEGGFVGVLKEEATGLAQAFGAVLSVLYEPVLKFWILQPLCSKGLWVAFLLLLRWRLTSG